MHSRKIALIVEYEGTRYHGFQIQGDVPTIQGELEGALFRLTGEGVRIACASRTDAGVHAKGQVVGFTTRCPLSLHTFVSGLNHYLPQDIAVRRALAVREGFDVRRSAHSREYCYYVLNSPAPSPLLRRGAYFVPQPLDVEAMRQACLVLVGRHDFAPFASSWDGGRNTVRTVYKAGIEKEGDVIAFHMVANSFLPHQVRNTVGALLRVGRGRMEVEGFWQIARSRTPGLAGPALPAHGLCLVKVNYPGGWDENL